MSDKDEGILETVRSRMKAAGHVLWAELDRPLSEKLTSDISRQVVDDHPILKALHPPGWQQPSPFPATTALGQTAAQIAPRLAEIFGGTAKEWEDSIVKRCTDEEPWVVHSLASTGALMDRVQMTRRNIYGVISGRTS